MIDLALDATQVAAIYHNGNKETRDIIKTALGDQFSTVLPITDRIKTFDDAYDELGADHQLCEEYLRLKYSYSATSQDLLAYAKLRIIVAALNEGWEPQFTDDEYRYYPAYIFYTQQEVDEMTEERKNELGLVLWGGYASFGSRAGLAFASSLYAFSFSSSSYGARLAFKSSDLAVYAGKQFIEIFANFCFIPSPKVEKTDKVDVVTKE